MQPRRSLFRLFLVAIVCLGALGVLVGLLTFRPKDTTKAAPTVPTFPETGASAASKSVLSTDEPPLAAPQSVGTVANRTADAGPVSDPSPASALAASPGVEQSIQRIEAAVVTYEAASLPMIAPYLTHADPELRVAAREGMLQMGLSEAVPLLREAAGKIKDPREAILLLDAADFLELPSVRSTAGKKRNPHPPSSPKPPVETSGER